MEVELTGVKLLNHLLSHLVFITEKHVFYQRHGVNLDTLNPTTISERNLIGKSRRNNRSSLLWTRTENKLVYQACCERKIRVIFNEPLV